MDSAVTKSLHLFPLPHQRNNQFVKRTCSIKRFDGMAQAGEEALWFEIDAIDGLPIEDDCESYLLAMLMESMAEGRDIVVHGAVSAELLSNLTEFRDAWVCWLPDKYAPVRIDVARALSGKGRKDGAICAFSGGVDACFSVWRNSGGRNGARTKKIGLCAMVHGFDIPVNDQDAFARAFHRSRETLASLDVPLRAIRTNYREISRLNWEHTFAVALVAALSSYKCLAGTILIGSGEPYNALVIPWGSSPITDHLLSGAEFFVRHEGASFCRTRKVLAISAWQAGVENLRVCWEGDLKDQNCGMCEKCVRTKLNFLANKLPVPPCFADASINLDDLRKIKLKNEVSRCLWRQILDISRQNNVKDSWVNEVNRKVNPPLIDRLVNRIDWNRLKDLFFPDGALHRRFSKKVFLFFKGNF